MNRAVFLDRDGTIIEDKNYIRDPKDVVLIPRAGEALRTLKEKGYLLYVTSNQSGVGRGIITDSQFKDVHRRCCELLVNEKVEIEQFLYCFHTPADECDCRKPKPGLLPKDLDFEHSYVIGDKACDLLLAKNISAKAFLVLTGQGKDTQQTFSGEYETYEDLYSAAFTIPDVTKQ